MAETITNFDFSILYYIQNFIKNEVLDILMPFFSFLGEGGLIWFAVCIPMLFFKKTRIMGVAGIVSLLITYICGELVLKNMICRVRPCNIDTTVEMLVKRPSSYSFPSGHTGTAFACAVSLFLYNKKVGIAAIAVALTIGFSRLYNFVHFPTDVLAGMILGVLFALLVYFVFKKTDMKNKLIRKKREK